MIVTKLDKDLKSQVFGLLYGETGVGKTVSTLISLPEKILYAEIDPKPLERTLSSIPSSQWPDIDRIHPSNFSGFLDYISDNIEEIPKKYKSFVIDPISFLMNISLMTEIEEETGRADVFEKSFRPLVNAARTDLTGRGAMSSYMKRLCNKLGLIAAQGCAVICIALQQEDPKWDRELSAGPSFSGKDFPRDMPSYFDLIGRAYPRTDESSEIVYPPNVAFRSPDGSFLAKWSGPKTSGTGILDWSKILKVATPTKKQKAE